MYDDYDDIHIVYTGSSMLEIDNSRIDLSRRQTLYNLNNMSFREFLEYETNLQIKPVKLDTLIKNHIKIANDTTSKCHDVYKSDFGDFMVDGNIYLKLVRATASRYGCLDCCTSII